MDWGFFIIGLAFALFAGIVSSLKYSLVSLNRIQLELDLREEFKYAETIEKLLGKLSNVQQRLSKIVSFSVVLSALMLTAAARRDLVWIIVAALFILLVSDLLPRVVALFYSSEIVKKGYKVLYILTYRLKVEDETRGRVEENQEIEIFKNALNLPDIKLKECMVPRTEICHIEKNSSIEEIKEKFLESNYSRIVITDGGIDRIIGYLHLKDLYLNKQSEVYELIRRIDTYTEEMSAKELLSILIKHKESICVVSDEYGGTAGIVTLEDIIEEIFGEISDEHDKEDLLEKEIGKGKYIFSGRSEIKYLNKEYDFDLPERDEYETLSGLLIYINENIPAEGEIVFWRDYEFKVVKKSSNRLDVIQLRIIES